MGVKSRVNRVVSNFSYFRQLEMLPVAVRPVQPPDRRGTRYYQGRDEVTSDNCQGGDGPSIRRSVLRNCADSQTACSNTIAATAISDR